MTAFEKTFHVRWGDMDFNAHILGGWMSLAERRLAPPPGPLVDVIEKLPRSDDSEEIGPPGR